MEFHFVQIAAWMFAVDIRIFDRPYVNDAGVLIAGGDVLISHRKHGDPVLPTVCLLHDNSGQAHYDALVTVPRRHAAGTLMNNVRMSIPLARRVPLQAPLSSSSPALATTLREPPVSRPSHVQSEKRSAAAGVRAGHVGAVGSKRAKTLVKAAQPEDIDLTNCDREPALVNSSRSKWVFHHARVEHHLGPGELAEVRLL